MTISSREVYGPRVKTLATFEHLGETFRVCWPRYGGKQWKREGHQMVIVHGEREMFSAFSPYLNMTVEAAIARFRQGAKGFEQRHGSGARTAMLAAIASMKTPVAQTST